MPENVVASEFAAQLLDPSFSPHAFAGEQAAPAARANSTWHGTDEALGKLGLRKGMAVRPRDLTAVTSGRHVRTGARVLPAGELFDLIFQAPNSVSWLWRQLAAEPRADVEDAMMDSSALMLDHLTADYPLVGGMRPARSFVASLVLHAVGTLSAANETIPPMLHVHCCLFAVMGETGTLERPDEATLYNEDALIRCDALAEARLAEGMESLGHPVNRTAGSGGPSFQMAGIPREVLEADFWQNTGCACASTSAA